MKAVVMFSGGKGSWAAAKRAADRYGTDQVVLLFADTTVEDDDTYRFLKDAAENIGSELVVVADGRDPFTVFKDNRWLGNSRLAHCSTELKVKPCREWLDANAPEDAVLVVGIDWTEIHRMPAIERGWSPRPVWAPMTEEPYLDPAAMLNWLREEGITPPSAYDQGFPHANCMAQGCVKGGQAYWRNIYMRRPAVFASTEKKEQELRAYLGTDVSMLKEVRSGTTTVLPLTELRRRIESEPTLLDGDEWGGCGCFVET
jgi:3'-phosphoadenosine 5'-phosphosulfate sulfotransferase (PAPS reductase)/FAD synthetase